MVKLMAFVIAILNSVTGFAEERKPNPNPNIYKEVEKRKSEIENNRKWICVADASTGFVFERGEWRSGNFDVSQKRYIVAKKKISTNKYSPYFFTEIGVKTGIPCANGGINKYGYLFCNYIYSIKVNVKALRYIKTYSIGFIDGQDNKQNTPNIEIGKCSPL